MRSNEVEEVVEDGGGWGRSLRCSLHHPPQPPPTSSTFRRVSGPAPQRRRQQPEVTRRRPCRLCLPSCASTGSRSPPRRSRGCPPSAAIDVVDFDYPYWHTTEDTIE